jgi:hypothetical protein
MRADPIWWGGLQQGPWWGQPLKACSRASARLHGINMLLAGFGERGCRDAAPYGKRNAVRYRKRNRNSHKKRKKRGLPETGFVLRSGACQLFGVDVTPVPGVERSVLVQQSRPGSVQPVAYSRMTGVCRG